MGQVSERMGQTKSPKKWSITVEALSSKTKKGRETLKLKI